MSTGDDHSSEPGARPTWKERVAVSQAGGGFAYVPNRILYRGTAARDSALQALGRATDGPVEDEGRWTPMDDVADPLALVELQRAEGFDVQPEHVFFAHPCAGSPHPSGVYGPDADPFRSHAVAATPFRSNPFRSNPFRSHDAPTSSACPATARLFADRVLTGSGNPPVIVVLDTGLAGGEEGGIVNADAQRPALLSDAGAPNRISGACDHPDAPIESVSGVTIPADGYLDPVAGHGTFIAGIIEQLAPGCTIRVERVIAPLGDGRELDIVNRIIAEANRGAGRPDIISMSFGGPVWEQAPALRAAIALARLKGIVMVASAGNDGVSTPQYPAAYDSVIGVGAVGPDGPPPWTNYGDWVDACAPGVDLVSSFFAKFDGAFPMMNATDVDCFAEWALWSGTSFSAPVAVAAIAREMVACSCSAEDAVNRVIHAPQLLRLRCLGTVVNL